MKLIVAAAFLTLPAASSPALNAQDEKPASTPATIDARIAKMTAEINASRLEKTVRDLVAFETRHVLSATDDEKRGTGAARVYLEKRLRELIPLSNGRLSVASEVYEVPCARLRQRVKIVNIIATLRGVSDPKRIYVVGGHYDSRNERGADGEGAAPGANDDGSGIAVALEACRLMCRHSFAATIQFACYDAEEHGLLGSEAHAKALADAGARVDGMITNDMVGNTLGMDGKRRRDHVRCFSYSSTGNDSSGRSLARAATRAARQHVPEFAVRLIYRGDRYGRGGDHRPFHKRGHPAIRLTEPREDYSRQHQGITQRDGKPYGDLPEYMDFGYVAKATALNIALLAELASAPPAPQRVLARGAIDAYDTDLLWPAVVGAHKYEVVWRQTTAADWQASGLIENPTQSGRGLRHRVTGVCLDDVVIGLRSVAANGSRSRVTTPPEPDASDRRRVPRRNR